MAKNKNSYTIADKPIDDAELRTYYNQAKEQHKTQDFSSLDTIFKIVCENRGLFPGINLPGEKTPLIYMERWVSGYCSANSNQPSKRIANPKSACTDPAIRVIVQKTQNLNAEEAENGEHTHNLFMSAENIQGNLLEEYIALNTRKYGFLWCEGNVLKAIDFCNTDGSLLLQIKNKNNTENSSSNKIREGTRIEKWYRLSTKSVRGVKQPKYKWEELNKLVSENRTEGKELPNCAMSEEGYVSFLKEKASQNSLLITNL